MPQSESTPQAAPEIAAAPQPKPENGHPPKPETMHASGPARAPAPTADLQPRIATRAYELYEQHGRKDGRTAMDWKQAEEEIRGDGASTKAEPPPKAAQDLTPQLIERVHALYEELGREEVRAVEELEKARRDAAGK